MAGRRNDEAPREYSAELICDFKVNSRVNEPLRAHLTLDYVRELVEVPDTEAGLVEEVMRINDRGESAPIWMQRQVVELAKKSGPPSNSRADWRAKVWEHAARRLQVNFRLSGSRAVELIHHALESIKDENGVVKIALSRAAIKKAVQRLRGRVGTD